MFPIARNTPPPLFPTDRETAAAMFRTLQQQAQVRATPLRAPPPEPTTCCGRGCNGCVWESYFAAAVFWREDALDALGG